MRREPRQSMPPYTCPAIDSVQGCAKDSIKTISEVCDSLTDVTSMLESVESEMEALRKDNDLLRQWATYYEQRCTDLEVERDTVQAELDHYR